MSDSPSNNSLDKASTGTGGDKSSDKPQEKTPETKGWLFKWTNYIKGMEKLKE